ncbi:NADPH:quinone oxidoreductase family protein [Methylobacterium frigidaeris]|uniref:2-haloacrylate reductase n=1 Tax=Methylobacterium frigidaeris TaxID=2038277 RepID=A0AA37HE61_9HYPH|nr:NADPH:quinone oxidoreductase family protein [Methylobacterium frigidaeris]PIK69098.1 NADPH:quinone oxidoreductase [Methylobacterium frigidaeris]GJD64108.1 2-haloacrylate reductase [Methylobacterium frigidaeris]
MKALLCKALGGPEDLVIEDVPDPVPGPGEALVRVTVAALNFFDTLIIAGRYQVKPDLPFSPGAEACGVIEALGPGVEAFRAGERVIVHLGYGACRERVVAPVSGLTRVPEGVSDEQAAGLSVTYGTSLHALQDRANLKPGETLAVLGATGGVGLAAVELGHAMGARVIACASSAEKLDLAKAHGADLTLDYSQESLRDGLKRLGGEAGIDVVYDPVGGAYSEPALRSLNWKGRFLVVGFAAGEIPKIPLNLALLKGIDIQGVFWGAFLKREPEGHVANQARLLALVSEGRLSAKVHGVYPLEEAASALGILARREAMGKVLLRP